MKKQLILITFVALTIFGCKKSEQHEPEATTTSTIPITPIDAPANLTATSDGLNQVTLDWDAVTDATGYKVYWSDATGVTTSSTALDATTDNYIHTDIPALETYYYNVTAYKSDATSDLATEVSATVYGRLGGNILGKALTLTGAVTTPVGPAQGTITSGTTDGTGNAARFNTPERLTTDGVNLYIPDAGNHNIRKVVIATGVVTTIAGTGSAGSVNATGTAASFNAPSGLMVTFDGATLYIADGGNHVIRMMVLETGVVTTFAGTMGVAETADTATNGVGTAAKFNNPSAITSDGANLYVVENSGHRIRKIEIATATVTTLAGSGTNAEADGTGTAASFNAPIGITYDGSNLYVADKLGNTIRKIVPSTGVVTTFVGGTNGYLNGTGTAAKLSTPTSIATDGTNLYFTEGLNRNRVRQIVIATGVVSTNGGYAASVVSNGLNGGADDTDGTGVSARFNEVSGAAVIEGALYISDTTNNKIRKIN